jgi:2-isopropylmalate synthase
MKIQIYDTTLRDGAQSEGISFSLEDKLRIIEKLDELGVHFIEAGWPGSNPKDIKLFEKVKSLNLKNAQIVAFGSTRHIKNKVEEDPNIKALINTGCQYITIFGKSWDLHVTKALKIKLEENLEIIRDSISYLRSKGKEVIYDAEHFFDAYKSNPEYALSTLKAAEESGASIIVLCDTNGGTMPYELEKIISQVLKNFDIPLGIHSHNDSEMAVANSILAVRLGCIQVQGTINGYGERCGNANLCSIIPNLKLKLGIECINQEQLKKLTEVSRFVNEIANVAPHIHQPYVGTSAFAHKGGIHVDAINKCPETYEHIDPELVGNHRRLLVSELAGKATILKKASQYNIKLDKNSPEVTKILKILKKMEDEGYQFEGADASFELLIKKNIGLHKSFFELKGFRVIIEKRDGKLISEATVKLVVEGEEEYTVAEGDGPVNALDNALRKALEGFYPIVKGIHLTDYKVRVLDAQEGTAAKVRVLIESSNLEDTWGTVGVSENIIEASYKALVDSIEYILLKKEKE